jgi:hypothetical protein
LSTIAISIGFAMISRVVASRIWHTSAMGRSTGIILRQGLLASHLPYALSLALNLFREIPRNQKPS